MDSSDAVSSGIGFIMSIIMSVSFLSFAQEALVAFVFGVMGAIGGWLANRFLIKPVEKKLKKWGWIS